MLSISTMPTRMRAYVNTDKIAKDSGGGIELLLNQTAELHSVIVNSFLKDMPVSEKNR